MLGQFGHLLRAIANGPDPARIPAPTEIIPTLPVEVYQPSFAFSAHKYLYTGYAVETAGAARSHVALRNPSGSGVVATITAVEAFSDVEAIVITVGPNSAFAAFDNDGAEGVRDTRLRVSTIVTRMPACAVITDDAAQTGDAIRRMLPIAEATNGHCFRLNTPIVLWPNASVAFLPNLNAKDMNCALDWEERQFDDQELSGIKRPSMAT